MTQTPRRYGADIVVTVATLLATALGGTARGQDLGSFDQVAARVQLGATIKVTCTDARELKGKLTQLSPSTLIILSNGTTTELRAGEIRSIYRQKPKPWTRDMLIGLGAGAAFGYAMADGSELKYMSATGFAGLGAIVGALFAAATPEPSIRVYELKTASSAVRLGVAPVVTPGRQGLTLTVRF